MSNRQTSARLAQSSVKLARQEARKLPGDLGVPFWVEDGAYERLFRWVMEQVLAEIPSDTLIQIALEKKRGEMRTMGFEPDAMMN